MAVCGDSPAEDVVLQRLGLIHLQECGGVAQGGVANDDSVVLVSHQQEEEEEEEEGEGEGVVEGEGEELLS